ncbi:hypothetical protein WR25_24739 [Diploscapter pachys]|uniref:Uncharacterized protein n=1 Tax=Diploscapter pachys TaxID=2018661 RepID=A0A2A2L223_9BILA|nr:hypothetical protein WR25_24739 [Diploscapter pachys]
MPLKLTSLLRPQQRQSMMPSPITEDSESDENANRYVTSARRMSQRVINYVHKTMNRSSRDDRTSDDESAKVHQSSTERIVPTININEVCISFRKEISSRKSLIKVSKIKNQFLSSLMN